MSIIYDIAHSILEIGEEIDDSLAVRRLNDLLKGTKLHSLTEDLRKYRKTERGKIKKNNAVKFQQYMLMIKIYLDVAEHIGAKWRTSTNKDKTKYRINTSLKLFHKSIQICLDLLTLMENGSLTSSLALWRMIYENYVVSMFLLNQNETISKMFNDHKLVEHNNILSSDHKQTSYKTDDVEKLKQEYGDHFTEPYGWAYEKGQRKIGTFSMIRKLTKENEFYGYYKLTSSLSHSSSLSVNRSFFSDGKRGNINMIGVFHQNLELPYRMTIMLMKSYANTLIDYFYRDDDSEKGVIVSINTIVSQFVLGNAG